MTQLIIATSNKGKYEEFRAIVGDFADEVVFAPQVGKLVVEETGKTYKENAMLKACAWAEKSGIACLADDSGLEVEALGGAPGLFSARVLDGTDGDKVSWLLSKLEGKANRKARFVASLALCVPNEYTLITEGYCYGHIASAPAGENGFGYDPVFVPDGYSLTFAQMDSLTKNSLSHRTNAFRKLLTIVHNL